MGSESECLIVMCNAHFCDEGPGSASASGNGIITHYALGITHLTYSWAL